MKPYIIALALGVLVGVIYALFSVRSPAPPIVALVGLLGILAGEQLPSLAKRLFLQGPISTSWLDHQVAPHMFGELPKGTQAAKASEPLETPADDGLPS
ncbi:XapX domain-containing protein [Variovorax sp. PvP013]|uniref:XapX domain-containing protein n=1 Tax=Variovorax sp. PvP013 TaxID=3156435 RepID=UPI003D25536F